jgi:hypothetical protein
MSEISIQDMNNQICELGWMEFCFKNDIRISHAQNIPNAMSEITVSNSNNLTSSIDGQADMIIEADTRFPPHTKAFLIMNFGSKSDLHTRNGKQVDREINIHMCSLENTHIYSMIRDNFQLSSGPKKFSIIWGYTRKSRGDYYIKKKDIQCVHIEDLAERNIYVLWVKSMKASQNILDNAENSILSQLKFKGFPMLLSRPNQATPDIYIDILMCLANCQYENGKVVMLKK